ncbi:MAG: hypothetical protein NZ519_13305 [Bacteroidia bacterium]|nr:hypothetical protein [Bacteroidia bacterium]
MLTTEKIHSIAPSSSVLEEAESITTEIFSVGKKDSFYWGQYKGSEVKPYTPMFNAANLTYTCSCTAAKRGGICKHVLGLMLRSIQTPEDFLLSIDAPPWAENWVKKQIQKLQELLENQDSNQEDKPTIGLARIRSAKSKEAQKREKQMSEGIELLKSYLNDVLNEGTTIAFKWTDKRKQSLIESLNASKMPELAYLIEEELERSPAETIAKSTILCNLWQKRDTLSPEVQEFLLNRLGSYLKKEDVQKYRDIVKDRWLCVGYYKEYRQKPTAINNHYWFLIGQNTGEWNYITHTEVVEAKINTEIAPNLAKGEIYEGSIAYYPGSQRGILLPDWRMSENQTQFNLAAPVTFHYPDKTINELPLFCFLRTASQSYIQKIDKEFYVQVQSKMYPCNSNLQQLYNKQGKEGITLIYLQLYPHSIIPLCGILKDGHFILIESKINSALKGQAKVSETLRKRLEVGKKLGNIELPGANNTGLEPIQQWTRAFLAYNYSLEPSTLPLEKKS